MTVFMGGLDISRLTAVETDASTKRQKDLNDNQGQRQKKETTHDKDNTSTRVKERKQAN